MDANSVSMDTEARIHDRKAKMDLLINVAAVSLLTVETGSVLPRWIWIRLPHGLLGEAGWAHAHETRRCRRVGLRNFTVSDSGVKATHQKAIRGMSPRWGCSAGSFLPPSSLHPSIGIRDVGFWT